jgi:hypothetical protein
VSVTVAVQVVAWLTTTEPGEHVTVVEVVRLVTPRLVLPELVKWVAEPPYDPLIVCVPLPAVGV